MEKGMVRYKMRGEEDKREMKAKKEERERRMEETEDKTKGRIGKGGLDANKRKEKEKLTDKW